MAQMLCRYEEFVKNHPSGTLFQSWTFGEFQEKIPYRGKSWALLVKGEITSSCLVIRQKLPLGFCWLWIPYGPLGDAPEIFEDLARIAKEERAIFARIEPPCHSRLGRESIIDPRLRGDDKRTDVKKWRIHTAKTRYTPEHTLILDLEKTEDELLAQMKPKGRYNIQVAKKHGVVVAKSRDVTAFYELLQKTGERDAFRIHPKYFYEKLLAAFGENAQLFVASYKNKIIAGIIVIFYKDTATYYYGASSYDHRNLMAPYLLQWEAIREAKRRSMKKYDFLGIAPPHEKNHQWSGVTEFKKKFGGKEVNYPEAFDIIYRPFLYFFYSLR